MDLFDVVKACIRRWYVFLPIVVLAVLSSALVDMFAKPSYSSHAMITLALPAMQPQALDPLPRNGLMDAGGAVVLTNVLVGSLTDPSVQARVVADGGKGNYTAKMFPVTQSTEQIPLIVVEASEPDPDSASETVQLVAAEAAPLARQMQQAAGVPEDQMVKPAVVSAPSSPEPETRGRLKLAIAILLIGVALAVVAAVVADVLSIRRNARADSQQQASTGVRDEVGSEAGSTTGGKTRKVPSPDGHVAGFSIPTSRSRANRR